MRFVTHSRWEDNIIRTLTNVLAFQSWFGASSCLLCVPRLTEMGIKSFWDMIDIAKKESLSLRDWVMQMPPLGRVRCLDALMAEIEATPPPESLRHSINMQETVDIMAEYRRILEGVLRKLMLQVWQSCARQLFAAADPARFTG